MFLWREEKEKEKKQDRCYYKVSQSFDSQVLLLQLVP